MTDSDLVTRARAGAEDAWAELVHRHQGAVFRMTHAALLHHEEAEEAAQDTWISAWRQLEAFRGQAAFRTWLLAIAWRKAVDRRRGVLAWVRAVRLDRTGDDHDQAVIELTSTAASAEAVAIDRQARARVRRVVKGLPRRHRDALLLMATGDLAYDEAPALLCVPVGTLKWRVSDARRLLRERMAVAAAPPGPGGQRKKKPRNKRPPLP
ncbi:MAG: RNA polymerase sigma factor, partial [Luteitalea sp.]